MKRLTLLPFLSLLLSGLLLVSLTGCREKPSANEESSIVGKWLLESSRCGFLDDQGLTGDLAKLEFEFTASGELYATSVVLGEVHREKVGQYTLTKDAKGTQLLRVTDTEGEGMEIEVRRLTKTELEIVSRNPETLGCNMLFKRL